MVIMMEEDNNIFFAGGDALVYLTKPIHKKYSTISIFGYPFSMYVSYDRFFNPSLCTHLYTFCMTTSSFPQLRSYLMDSLFLNQKTDKNIR